MLRSPLQLAVLALILGILAVGLIPPSFAKDDSPQPGETLAPNDAKESLRKEFSLAAALKFSQTVADQWAQKRNCVTCHTNGLHRDHRCPPRTSICRQPAHQRFRQGISAQIRHRSATPFTPARFGGGQGRHRRFSDDQ